MDKKTASNTFFASSSLWLTLTLAFLLILGLGIRLYDLTDPPLDFHSTRQLYSALIARGMYYRNLDSAPAWQREAAMEAYESKSVIEPRIFETLVALTYRLIGREVIWVARIYAALFWIIGGAFLYLLAKEMTSPDGGVVALAFYLVVPFGAIASRSFQPDPLMVMWIVIAWWAFTRWHRTPTWKTAIIAGLTAGVAILVKSVAVFLLLGGMAALILVDRGIENAIRNGQVWLIAGLAALPVAVFMLYGLLALEMESQFQGRFFPQLLTDPAHYLRWVERIDSVVSFELWLAALVGAFAFRKPSQRAFLLGLWGGYFVYGLVFPYHFVTHNYYHLPLIPLVGLSLASLGALILAKIASLDLNLIPRLVLIGMLVLGVAIQLWDVRVTLAREDFRHEPPYWAELGALLDRDADIIALTHDYGDRLAYYGWVNVHNWPETKAMAYRELRGGETMSFDEWFADRTEGMDYFLVTRLNELSRQQELYAHLTEEYPVVAEGEGYILFDLNQPKNP